VADFPQIAAQVDGYEVVVPLAPPPMVHSPAIQPAMVSQPAMIVPGASIALVDEAGHVRPMEQIETEALKFAIEHYRGQMSQVARRLGIGRSTLYRKLKDLGLEEPVDVAEEV